MVAEDQVILTERSENRLTHINLRSHEVRYFYHKFIADHSHDISLHYFDETDFFCVEEKCIAPGHSITGKKDINLTYYCLPLVEGGKSFASYKSNGDEY
jgi:hypothetical protein